MSTMPDYASWDVETLMSCFVSFDAHIEELQRKKYTVKAIIERRATDRCPECGSPFKDEERWPCDDGPNDWHGS